MPDPLATLVEMQERLGAVTFPFGPPVCDGVEGGSPATQLEAVEDFGQPEAEYAAVRRHVGVLHLPWRRVLPITGADVRDFLHRLLTQDIKTMTGGQTRRALLLDQKGRIQADTLVHFGDAETWIELDAFDAGTVRDKLDAMLFAEDVTLGPTTDEDGLPTRQCFALLGPASVALLEALRVGKEDDEQAGHPPLATPDVTQVVRLSVPNADNEDGRVEIAVSVTRRETCGVMELRLWCRSEHALALYTALLDAAGYEALPAHAGSVAASEPGASATGADQAAAFAERRRASLRGRPVGWSAYNTARLEAGTPLFHIDFGPDSLPAEAGVVEPTISFTKGCFPGQEAVARMKNLGHPKKLIVGLKLDADTVPLAGTPVYETADADDHERVIGGVTSSAVSPLWGQQGLALAMLRWGRHEPGTAVTVVADGQRTPATVINHADFPAAGA